METINIKQLTFKNKTMQESFNKMLNNGFRVFVYDPTLEQLTDGFIIAPKWAKQSDIAKVKKYILDNWIEKESQKILKYKEVIL